jgi:glycosyltransferase involved in cell wall biosynthesis
VRQADSYATVNPTPPGGVQGAQNPGDTTRPRIVLAHDWLVGLRGGERVLHHIARVAARLGSVEAILTMFDDGAPLTDELDAIPRQVATLGRLPGALRMRRWLLPVYPAAVGQLSDRLALMHRMQRIDLVVSTSSAAIKGLRTPPGVPHVCYCHSPARYLWSQADQYGGRFQRLGLRAFGGALRSWDRATAGHVDAFLANSTHVARLIATAYGREAKVIHPPARTEFFTPGTEPRERHWLAVGAIEPYKRFDLAIEAARRSGVPLRIVGDGSVRAALERSAPAHVRFLGRVSDEQLRREMRTAAVLLFPQVEDFGITAVEAQACGLPVAARAEGGALDIVRDGQTGALCDGSPETLAEAANRAAACDPARCVANARRFSEASFEQAIQVEFEHHLKRPAAGPASQPHERPAEHRP